MKTVKYKILVQVTLLFLMSVYTAQAATTLKVIGKHPFYKPALTSVDDFRTMMDKSQADVVKGLEVAGYPQLAGPLLAQFGQAQVTTVDYGKGETFLWMFFKRNGKGKVRVAKDITWDGQKPFTGYEFAVEMDDKRYIFAVPLVCGNIALKEVVFVPVEVVPEPVALAPPVEEPEPVFVEPYDPIHFVADVGYLRMPDPADYVFGRAGIEYKLNPQVSFLGMVGGAPKVSGADGKSAFLMDLLAQYNWSSVFVGLGVGGWITSGDSDIPSENSGVDLIGNVGVRVLGDPDEFNTSIFLEARSAFDEFSDLKDYGRFGAGVRFSL